ncbi:hypothetical protein MLD38_007998 [Melastoma candidum]|uniref:Uncharacterized protein n=1 Tax=Melastoma candidum TaxID=119954 RepID=A0ACB9RSW4_9MYRT|nr:hypothetical protein MLD38_007998 [Melastoma candidum]
MALRHNEGARIGPGDCFVVLMGILSEISVELLVSFGRVFDHYGRCLVGGPCVHVGVFDQWLGNGFGITGRVVILVIAILDLLVVIPIMSNA